MEKYSHSKQCYKYAWNMLGNLVKTNMYRYYIELNKIK